MGGIATVDFRLLDLASRGYIAARQAHELAALQLAVSVDLGHILAYGDEYVWRRIGKLLAEPYLGNIRVRCQRCPAVAPLRAWRKAISLGPIGRSEIYGRMLAEGHGASIRFLDDCDGPTRAGNMIHTLAYMAGIDSACLDDAQHTTEG
jgi:hypothetical protein